MKSRKILDSIEKSNIEIIPVFSDKEVIERNDDYLKLSDKDFDEKYRERAFSPIHVNYKTYSEDVQYNYCTDPFCPNYGNPLEVIVPRGSRSVKNYMFANKKEAPVIRCNIMNHVGSKSRVDNNSSTLVSNWSIAEEIKRLITLNRVIDDDVEYVFHEPTCTDSSTPFDKQNGFIKYGKTNAGSNRFKCKVCEKVTSVKPSTKESHNYGLKVDNITLSIFQDIISRVPVKKICERNDITPTTFYHRIDFIYQKCLAFLERYEGRISDLEFDDLYLASDSFIYMLNNIRRKGKGGSKQSRQEKANATEAMTYMITTGDVESFYVFRSDICYDTFIRLDDIIKDTKLYHCDHTFPYLRKNDRIRYFTHEPQEPTSLDSESQVDYLGNLAFFKARDNFVEGLHTQQNYTIIAHMHLLKQRLTAKRIVFTSDNDGVIKQSIFRVFKDVFNDGTAYYLTSQYDKTLDRQDAFKASLEAKKELDAWIKTTGSKARFVYDKAIEKVSHDLLYHDFESVKIINGNAIKIPTNNLYPHPLPAKDEGKRNMNLISPKGYIGNDDLAEMIVKSNTRVVDNFFQEIRRHLNVLERPLVGARGTGKTYIYANYNPKYAQQLVTIYRTYYNFCKLRKYYNRKKADMTPAMNLGLVDRVFDFKDIIYFR